MVTLWKKNGNGIVRTAILEAGCWINVTDPSELEMETLEREYGVTRDAINDILDLDERSRYEREDEYELLIVRIPEEAPEDEVPYVTIPVGIILTESHIITVCRRDNNLTDELIHGMVRSIDPNDKASFVLRIMLRAAVHYLRHLKAINRSTREIERELQKSIKNNELVKLLNMEKSLVYFATSLKGNELLLEKLQKTQRGFLSNRGEELEELLEDVVTENRQAIEMANIYSNILSGLMDAFASVISNNLNVVMKRITSISLILMIPTLIASVYGMNINLPFQDSPLAFLGIVAGSVVLSIVGVGIFLRKRYF